MNINILAYFAGVKGVETSSNGLCVMHFDPWNTCHAPGKNSETTFEAPDAAYGQNAQISSKIILF